MIALIIIFTLVSLKSNLIFADNNCQSYLPTEIKVLNTKLANQQLLLTSYEQHISNNQYQLIGNANVHSTDFSLQAQQVNIDKDKNSINASKEVQLSSKNMVFKTDNLSVINIDGQSKFSANNVYYYATDRILTGSASNIIGQNNYHQFNQTVFSSCPEDNKVWQIRASSLKLDNNKNRGYAHAAKFELLGIPIFYLPYYTWVLSGRASGFLTTNFGSYNSEDGDSGFEVSQPYYFNLAPHKDLTISLDYLSESGFGIGGNYRHLLTQQDLEIIWRYFPDDNIKKRKRWQLELEHQYQINRALKLTTDINRVSDRDYFTDIEHQSFSDRTLNSAIELSYRQNGINAFLIAESEQLIDGNSGYTRKPGLQISKRANTTLGQFYTLADVSNFDNQQTASPTGLRSHLQLGYSKNSYLNNINIKPQLNLYQTHYNLDRDDGQSRSIINFGIDASLHFDQLVKKDYLHTLTPRIFYNYTQNKNQTRLPNFDSSLKTFSYQSLFSSQIYSGFDRLQVANNVVVGLESNWYRKDSGQHLLSANIAQVFYKNKTYNPFELDNKSDIVLQTTLNGNNNELEARLQYDTNQNSLNGSYYFWRYKPNDNDLFALEYVKEENRNISVYTKTKLSKNYRTFLALQYDLDQDISNRQVIGINYQNCCLSINISYLRSQNDASSNHNDKISINFDLIGFISGAKSKATKRYNDDLSDWF